MLFFDLATLLTIYSVVVIEYPGSVRPLTLGPSYMVSGTRDNPPSETTLSSVSTRRRCLRSPSQSSPCMIIRNPYQNNQMCIYPSFFEFSSVIRSK